MWTSLLTGLMLLSLTFGAWAHPAPFSYLDLHLDADETRLMLVVHDFDAAHELGIERPELLLDAELAAKHRQRLAELLETRLELQADGAAVALHWRELEVLPERQSLRWTIRPDRHHASQLRIAAHLFPYDPNHQTFVNIYERGTLKHQAVLDVRRQELSYYPGTAQGRWAVIRTFVKSGVHHILIGPDHVLFLLGLLLLGGSLWHLAGIVTAFTLGHSVTLSLAALDLVSVPTSIVEPAIALSIVVIGVDNLLMRQGGAQARTGRDLRPWLAGAFGLIHGFGFAAVLLEFGLPRDALGWSLAAFNVGVEIGQLAIVAVLAALLGLLRRHRPRWGDACVVAGSVAVAVAGAYWFVQRVWIAPA